MNTLTKIFFLDLDYILNIKIDFSFWCLKGNLTYEVFNIKTKTKLKIHSLLIRCIIYKMQYIQVFDLHFIIGCVALLLNIDENLLY
jgi:hypothetical protein